MSGEADRLQLALAAENASVYAYGVIGAWLTDDELSWARSADLAHRRQRDAVSDLITAAGGTPTPAAPAYQLPKPVTGRAEAVVLAVDVETRAAAVWRSALGALTGNGREVALDALVGAAVRAAQWRTAAGPGKSPIVPWPGGASS
ncbi:ferritin-like domain-containing protein [Cryptosporangium arvum]|uniref:ferritin-like domain-containing protein n=1 Tax=Cryptosporangium arvum TaxID=80871 RepID=UPI0004B335CB|nr:ferritin-like domain-containing protein [Cryptosporangium arvum]